MNQTPGAAAQKLPALINWLGILAITLLVVLPVSVMTVRSGAWQQGLLLYAIGCFGAAILCCWRWCCCCCRATRAGARP